MGGVGAHSKRSSFSWESSVDKDQLAHELTHQLLVMDRPALVEVVPMSSAVENLIFHQGLDGRGRWYVVVIPMRI